MNICTFTGRLTKDPELKSTPSGVSYVRFTLAVERGSGKDNTDFLRFVNIKKKKEKTTAAACDQEPDTTQAPTATPQSAVESQNNNMVHEDISDTPQNCDDYEDFLVDCYEGEFPLA